KANPQYPAWFRGKAPDGRADATSHYSYKELVGPSRDVKRGLHACHLRFGTLVLKPGRMYPAHNHPAAEGYYVVRGRGMWYVDDECQEVGPGSVIYHRPYAAHGWRNLSAREPLELVWVWWAERARSDVLEEGARFTNPKLVKGPASANVQASPVPAV